MGQRRTRRLAEGCSVLVVAAVLAASAASAGASSSSPPAPGASLVSSFWIPGGYTLDPVYGGSNGNLYFSGLGNPTANGTVTVVSGASNQIIATAVVGVEPGVPTVDPANGDVYVPNMAPGCGNCGPDTWQPSPNITVISGATNSPIASIPAPGNQGWIFYDPADGDLYLLGDNGISVFSGATDALLATFGGGQPSGLVFDSWNGDVYLEYSSIEVYSVSNASHPSKITSILVGTGGLGRGFFDPVNGDLYFFGNNVGVAIISGSNNSVIRTLSFSVGPPFFVDPNGNVWCFAPGDPAQVSVISGATNTVTATFSVGEASGIGFDVAMDELFTTEDGSGIVNVTSAVTHEQVASLSLASDGLIEVPPVYDPANGDVYVLANDGFVGVISGSPPATSGTASAGFDWVAFGVGLAVGGAVVGGAAYVALRPPRPPKGPYK